MPHCSGGEAPDAILGIFHQENHGSSRAGSAFSKRNHRARERDDRLAGLKGQRVSHPDPGKAESKTTPPVGIASPTELRLIPLDQLSLSPHNVRQISTSVTDDAELLASISENGIKQNLVVYPSGEDVFHVDAGGHRLKAPQQLAEDTVIPPNHPFPCLVEDESEAICRCAHNYEQKSCLFSTSELCC